jgi:sulfur carrier protein
VRIVLNGEVREVEAEARVADAVALAGAPDIDRGVAVAVEGEVVPRGEWERRVLAEGDAIEVVHAVQGG